VQTIDYLHIISATAFFLSAVHKLRGHQQEHFFTRFVAGAWFALTVMDRDIDIDMVRIISNCVIIAIPVTEMLSPQFTKYWRNKK
jgi:hypothetical protein